MHSELAESRKQRHASRVPRGMKHRRGKHLQRGFALVVTMALMVLLTLVAMGVLSLSAISLRNSDALRWRQQARDNARLALTMAIGELQRNLGPDRSVSAEAGILAQGDRKYDVAHPHWTAAWPTHTADGQPVVRRDPETGSMIDARSAGKWRRAREAVWLVSGNEGGQHRFQPEKPLSDTSGTPMVGGETSAPGVVAPRVKVGGANRGHYAWWVGDLGVRANLASGAAALANGTPKDAPLLSRRAELDLLDPPLQIADADRARLETMGTAGMIARKGSLDGRHFDFTVDSTGVLANPRDGGLKRDLTAFLNSRGRIAPMPGGTGLAAAGLSDEDRMVGPQNRDAAAALGESWADSPFQHTAPRFGLLRTWTRIPAESGGRMASILPKPEPRPVLPRLENFASANLSPASIADSNRVNIAPALVEGALYTTVSYHKTDPGGDHPFQIRLHVYPRVTLWNPYNVSLTLPKTMAVIHVNGRKETRIRGEYYARNSDGEWGPIGWQVTARGIWFVGGRNTEFRDAEDITKTTGYLDPYIGSFYFALPETRFGPGECLVFSAAEQREYDSQNLANNLLSANVAPHPSRSFAFSSSEINGGITFRPDQFWEGPPDANEKRWLPWDIRNQADDYRVILKQQLGSGTVGFRDFDSLPQIAYLSASAQYGAGREPRISWADGRPMAIEETDRLNPRPTVAPDVRTRQGIRLRWFRETRSNIINSGALAATPHFQSAPLANWNPRAAYAIRSPWENIAGPLPADNANIGGDAVGGPWFFGIYTRDLFDPEIGWNNSMPVLRGGHYHGNPFGPPIEGEDRYVVFDVAPKSDQIVSLARFQHLKLSEFVWHPSLAAGQSLVDPRCGLLHTLPVPEDENDPIARHGWNAKMIGWSSDRERSKNSDEWAAFGRAIAQNYPDSDALVYDLSYEVNCALWDRFFLSSGDPDDKKLFAAAPLKHPLPNPRMLPHTFAGRRPDSASLADFHKAAAYLMLDGAFNVNSTSVEAWLSLLSATRGLDGRSGTVFPRLSKAPETEWDGQSRDPERMWAGGRELSDPELRALAKAIVSEVKLRGPFLGLADFVNRRLADGPSGRSGTLQAAIDRAGLNLKVHETWPLDNQQKLPDYRHPDHIDDATSLGQTLKPDTVAWGAPGYLTQADVLQIIGPALAARSDTFVVRAYGDAYDTSGRLRARAWCEAVVQRMPEPLDPDASGLNPKQKHNGSPDFGRRFEVKRFRWLRPEDI